jgi:hypothetical protein
MQGPRAASGGAGSRPGRRGRRIPARARAALDPAVIPGQRWIGHRASGSGGGIRLGLGQLGASPARDPAAIGGCSGGDHRSAKENPRRRAGGSRVAVRGRWIRCRAGRADRTLVRTRLAPRRSGRRTASGWRTRAETGSGPQASGRGPRRMQRRRRSSRRRSSLIPPGHGVFHVAALTLDLLGHLAQNAAQVFADPAQAIARTVGRGGRVNRLADLEKVGGADLDRDGRFSVSV